MVISSFLLYTKEDLAEHVATQAEKLHGVEVHHVLDQNKVIITLEADTLDHSYEVAKQFEYIKGILSINLVYYSLDENEAFMEETQ